MMDEMTDSERRQQLRFFLNKPITYQVISSPDRRRGSGIIDNITSDGLCLITERTLEEDEVLTVRLPLPDVTTTIPTLAEVRWTKQMQEEGSCMAGLIFLL